MTGKANQNSNNATRNKTTSGKAGQRLRTAQETTTFVGLLMPVDPWVHVLHAVLVVAPPDCVDTSVCVLEASCPVDSGRHGTTVVYVAVVVRASVL